MNIPLIIPCFNQLTFLKNLVMWFKYYYPANDVYILDNASTYVPLLDWYEHCQTPRPCQEGINVVRFNSNSARENLRKFLDDIAGKYKYYVISDPDIMPTPSTPSNFLEIFQHCIDSGYHHVGFGLKIDDLPECLEDRANVIANESGFWKNPKEIVFGGKKHTGYKAPIDTTFAMYKDGSGWEAPMRSAWWDNCLRMFSAYHLGWYIDPAKINSEMENYFKTAKYHKPGDPSAGENNYRPTKFKV